MKKKIGLSIFTLQGLYGNKKALEIAKNVGADAVDFNICGEDYDYRNPNSIYSKTDKEIEEYFTSLKDYANEIGIEICQTHGRIEGFKNIKEEDDAYIENARIDCLATKALGCPVCVMHGVTTIFLGPDADPQLYRDLNFDMFTRILPHAKKYGIKIAEYGSYYKIAQSEPELFSEVLASARALDTKIIRVWPGMNTPSDTISEADYQKFINDARRICDEAPDMTIALECHPHSLTDEYHHALDFIKDVARNNFKTFWQPNQYRSVEYNLEAINALMPYIVSVHVFSWKRKSRYPLAEGESDWKKYIELLADKDISYMLEFMHDDRIETLSETAKVLNDWLN